MLSNKVVSLATWSRLPQVPCRTFTTHICLNSGHNRWSKIKHDKGKKDAATSKERTFLTLNIIRLSKEGGPDPALNTSLAYAITTAKKSQVSKDAIEKAIAKGQGKSLSGASLDNVLIEAMLPHGVAAIMEGQTESKNRIMADVKSIVQRAGGVLTPTAFSFEKKGKVWFKQHETIGLEEAMDEAIEAGAEDIIQEDGQLIVDTIPENVSAIGQKLRSSLGLVVERTQILFEPKEETLARLDEIQASDIQGVLDQLEELDDLQEIYINAVSEV